MAFVVHKPLITASANAAVTPKWLSLRIHTKGQIMGSGCPIHNEIYNRPALSSPQFLCGQQPDPYPAHRRPWILPVPLLCILCGAGIMATQKACAGRSYALYWLFSLPLTTEENICMLICRWIQRQQFRMPCFSANYYHPGQQDV